MAATIADRIPTGNAKASVPPMGVAKAIVTAIEKDMATDRTKTASCSSAIQT
jgi:hypothetical protein